MPQPKHCSPFARKLLLSESETSDLKRRANTLVADALGEYEQFLWRQHGAVSATQWALERDKDDLRLYHSCRNKTPTQQELLVVGTLHGELDDALFGVLSTTTEALRLRAAYTKDRLSNGAVLATVQKPTRTEPFRALTVQWLVGGEPLHVRALASGKKSDVVAIAATGTSALSNGETMGFLLLHSVELAQTPALPQYERATVSLCALWRQLGDDRVQLYARAAVGASDKSHATRATRATSGALLCLGRSIHCAQMKKLAWLMRCKASQLGGGRRGGPPFRGSNDLYRSSSSSDRGCEVCPSHMTMSSSRRTAKTSCIVCTRLVCSDCRVKRELCSITLDGRLLEQRMAFCVPCHTIASRAAAADVASEEAARMANEEAESSHAASLVHVPRVVIHDHDDHGSSPLRGSRPRGFGDEEEEEDKEDDDSDDEIADVDRVLHPRKSLQTSSAAGTLEADDDELEGARRARGASGLAPSFMR